MVKIWCVSEGICNKNYLCKLVIVEEGFVVPLSVTERVRYSIHLTLKLVPRDKLMVILNLNCKRLSDNAEIPNGAETLT